MKIQTKTQKLWMIIIPLVIAWCFDLLFWKKMWGVSFPIMTALTLAGGFGLAAIQGIRPHWRSLLLVIPALFFSIMTVFRAEPFTMALDVMLTILSVTILAASFTGGQWWLYSLTDYIEKGFHFALALITKPFALFARTPAADGVTPPNEKPGTGKAVLRGILFSIPILLVLAALLASADLVFASNLRGFLSLFKVENLGETAFRLFYILVLAFFLAGAYLYAYQDSEDKTLRDKGKPGLPRVLGTVEASVILISINLLFIAFLAIQFRYLFGGQANIHLNGFTYSEYARKGFGELTAVAIITLLLLQGIHSLVKYKEGNRHLGLTGLSMLLVVQVLIILVSAYTRLTLYESAYGFSRLRTYTHVFLFWLGLLLILTASLEIARTTRLFPLAVLLAAFGFAVNLNVISVDATIVRLNMDRATADHVALDVGYLASLSADSVPALARIYQAGDTPAAQKDLAAAALACKVDLLPTEKDFTLLPWTSYSFIRAKANALLAALKPDLAGYPVLVDDNGSYVMLGTTRVSCDPQTID
jgi:hypothetical protein